MTDKWQNKQQTNNRYYLGKTKKKDQMPKNVRKMINAEFHNSQPRDGLIADSERKGTKHLQTQGRMGTMPSHEIGFV